jgi:hypothetical protein
MYYMSFIRLVWPGGRAGLAAVFVLAAWQLASAVEAPTGLVGLAGDQSIILHWDRNTNSNLAGYRVYRSTTGAAGPFSLLNSSLVKSPGYCDLSSQVVNGQTNFYYVTTMSTGPQESSASSAAGATSHPFASDDEFLNYVQQANFDYFWYLANPVNGLVPDRSASGSPCSIAAQGFGMSAICIGVDHGWITRSQAAARVRTSLNTFWQGPQGSGTSGVIGHQGWFYHFLDMNSGLRAWSCEISSIDTALLLAGILDVRQYFNGNNAEEAGIRSTADAIFNRVNWQWMANGGSSLTMGWYPESGFISARWIGYNEAMVLYIMGLGAAANPLPAAHWASWTSGYDWGTAYGQTYVLFSPLFGHQYSHCWIDFRHVADDYMNDHGSTYFENSRRAALAEVAYCNTAPHTGYSSNVWGLTACDGPPPNGYAARGLPPALDDGTIAPTAAGGSICFTPGNSLATLKYLYQNYRTALWTENGFRDAFNPGLGWYDTDEVGIDQGPIVIAIENYRTQRVWKRFMQSAEVQRGLSSAGFVAMPPVALDIQSLPAQNAIGLSWGASARQSYQIEYSPDLLTWMAAPGFVHATNSGACNWRDSGPPATVSAPGAVPQRFYRVFQIGRTQLLNAGFESGNGTSISNWVTYGSSERETWAAHSGSYGMALEWWWGSSAGFYQDVAATSGATYTVSVWCADDAATVTTSVYRIKLEYYDNSMSLLGSDIKDISPLVNSTWRQLSLAGNPISANTASVRVVFDASNMISGETLKLDDVSLAVSP